MGRFLFLTINMVFLNSCSGIGRMPASDFFKWPVANGKLTQEFRFERGDPHFGIDIAAPRGTPILASHTGTVVYAGSGFSGFGKMVLLENENGWATLYAHLHQINVKTGQRLYQGQPLGTMGSTGRSTGVHLHFEVRYDKRPIDPLGVLSEQRILNRLAEY